MHMSENTLLLLHGLLGAQQINVSAPDEEIMAVLQAKKELEDALQALTTSRGTPSRQPKKPAAKKGVSGNPAKRAAAAAE